MNSEVKLYPLKFLPIVQDKVWGGEKLAEIYQKGSSKIAGESWELSGVDGFISEVSNGKLKGQSLVNLIDTFEGQLLGERVFKAFGNTFPLLFKFIDAKEDLSVQLHPDDIVAQSRHNSFGKTEMWYILETDENARLILGFNREMDQETYLKFLSEEKLTEILKSEPVEPGDAFFLAPGTVHAIGAGVMLAEIQQTSDITYRIYDWDRPGTDGKMRELHTDLALDVIDFNAPNPKLHFEEVENASCLVCESSYFVTNKINLTKNGRQDYSDLDSFVVIMCLEGAVNIQCLDSEELIRKGDTILIPALAKEVYFNTDGASLLEVYVP